MPLVFARAETREQAREIAAKYEGRGWRCVEDGGDIVCTKKINEIQNHTVVIQLDSVS